MILGIYSVWFMSKGTANKTMEQIISETGFVLGPNDDYVIGNLTQKIEYKYGIIFLLLSITIQFISNTMPMYMQSYNFKISDITNSNVLLLLSGLIATIFYLIFSGACEKEKKQITIDYLKARLIGKYDKNCNPNPSDLKRYCKYLNMVFTEEGSLEEAWGEVRNKLGL